MKYPAISTIDQVVPELAHFDTIIDVRSPSEYAEDHLPGAINCPVLNDEERVQVGTLYKQVGSFEAKRLGAGLVAMNISKHLATTLAQKPREWRPLIYCWRGGNRSGSMAHILAKIGWPVTQLDGGYKSYRNLVNQQLAGLVDGIQWRVLCGPTGSGKSRLLNCLEQMGEQVLDLEGLACHKGSVLGDIPSQKQPSQKYFETLLWEKLRTFDKTKKVYVEAESKKVGNLRVPESIMTNIREAACISLEPSIEYRVQFLMEDYPHFIQQPEKLNQQLDYLAHLHGKEKIQQWKEWAHAGTIEKLVTDLLQLHYDPAYNKSIRRNFVQFPHAACIQLARLTEENLQQAADFIRKNT